MQNVEQDRGDAGKEVCRTGGMKERRMKDRRDLGHEGYRKGEIQERRKAGRGMQDRRDARSHVRKVGYRFFVNCLFCRLYCTAGNQMYSKKKSRIIRPARYPVHLIMFNLKSHFGVRTNIYVLV